MHINKPSLVFKDTLQARTSTDFCIVHHADAIECDIYDIQKWHLERGFIGVGYNYFTDKNGVVWQGRPEWASDADARGHNYDSLSICLEGRFTKEQIQSKQRDALIELMLEIKKKYPKIKFMRHKDVNNTSCPGDIGWADILSQVDIKFREISHKSDDLEENIIKIKQMNKKIDELERKIERVVEHFDRKINSLDSKLDSK